MLNSISDTARWVALYRAWETERPDAIFRDPHARQLAGARGEEIVRTIPRARAAAWAMVVRTAVIDELLLDLIRHQHVDTVVNLAAGLDARPWRLALPPALRWIDVDLPEILEHKTKTIGDASAHCRYESIHADLTDAETRRNVLGRLADESGRAVVLSEGLLIYLTASQVSSLSRDLYAAERFLWWITDLATPRLLAMMSRSWGKSADAANAPFQFAPAEGPKFFETSGWRVTSSRYFLAEARRLRREMRLAGLMRFLGLVLPPRIRKEYQEMASIVVLERAGS